MKLQLALDFLDVEAAAAAAVELDGVVDIIEAGTLFILKEGIRAVNAIKRANPHMQVLADLKIMDAGDHEARLAFEAGADLVTVLAAASDATITACVREAKACGRAVVADMIAVRELTKRAKEVEALGADYICVHTAFDLQAAGQDPLAGLALVTEAIGNEKTAVAGGVKKQTLPAITALRPAVVVVGGAITCQADMRAAAVEIRGMLDA